jgi:tetratricopeptide (TPR) repeat protein
MTISFHIAAAVLAATVGSPLYAQVPAPPPAPARPLAPAPTAPAPTARPPLAVPAPPAPPVALLGPDFDFVVPEIEWPDVVWPEIDYLELREVAENARLAAQGALTQIQPPKPAPPGSASFVFVGKGANENLYNQARSYIDRDQYERALEPLDRLIASRGARTDAAMYWKAYSQLKLARHAEALATLAELRKQFPTSSWVRDASALEVEVRQASGQSVNAAEQASDDLKLLALQGIMRSDPDTAIPVIEKTLAGSSSVRVKDRALFVLSQSRAPRAREVITSTAKGASNPDLRLAAIRYLGRMSSPESQQALEEIYRGTNDIETKRAILQALATDRNAAARLVALARVEKDQELKTEIVRRLANSQAPEAREYLVEILR